MEQKCVSSADTKLIEHHLNTKSIEAVAIANVVEEDILTMATPGSPTVAEQLRLVAHKNQVNNVNVCDEDREEEIENLQNNTHTDNSEQHCKLSSATVTDKLLLKSVEPSSFDEDSRSRSSDDFTTPITNLQRKTKNHFDADLQHENGDDNSNSTTSTSSNINDVIQDQLPCQETLNIDSGIYLETPVVDEQSVGLNIHEHHYEKAKPKRLDEEFLLPSDDYCDGIWNHNDVNKSSPEEESVSVSKNDESDNLSSSSSGSGTQEHGEKILNKLLIAAASTVDRMDSEESEEEVPATTCTSFNHEHPKPDPGSFAKASGTFEPTSDIAEGDVQSMDAIERRDYEHEQRITGGILLKSSSLAKSDRLNLGLIQPFAQESDNPLRATLSDSKCAYLNHPPTTPTTSRPSSSRLVKSTAKINLTNSFSHSENISVNEDTESDNNQKDVKASSSNSDNTVVKPGASTTIGPLSSSKATSETSSSVRRRPMYEFINEQNLVPIFPSACIGKRLLEIISTDIWPSDHSYSTSSSHSLSQSTKSLDKTTTASESNSNVNLNGGDAMMPCTSSARCHFPGRFYRNNFRNNSTNTLNCDETSTLASASDKDDAKPGASTSGLPSSVLFRSRSNYDNLEQQLNDNASASGHRSGLDLQHLENDLPETDFDEESWADCEEGSDEETCTCPKNDDEYKQDTCDMIIDDNGPKENELSNYIQMVSISEEGGSQDHNMPLELCSVQRKRKLNDNRGTESETFLGDSGSGRKRIAYDLTSTPRTTQSCVVLGSPPTPFGRGTPRSIIPTRDNPPPELQDWLSQFQRWTHAERILAVDRLIEHCEPTQVRHMMKVIEPQFQRDFISLLPRELALQVLAYLDPKDLLKAAQTCRSWRFLCDDNLLWKEKCRKAQILAEPHMDRPKRGRAGTMPPIASPWKAAYIRQHIIEMNWRSRPIRDPKILKGHDDHVITCLQFSGNRIVSGSDDNTLKVWSAVTGRCLRTLVGHTGGVWSSQMSGNIVISGSTDRTLKVWDLQTGECVHTLLGHTSTVRCMHLHGNRVVSGSRDATLRVWDIEHGSCLHVLVGHLAAVRCVQYDGKLIVSGAYDYMVKIWNPEKQECLHTLQGHTNRVYSLQFDGIHVVTGSLDTSIRVWDAQTGTCKHTLMGHQSLTSGMELRQNILVSGNADSTVKVWDIRSGQCLQTLSGPNKHQSAVTCLQFNSRFVITSSDDGTVKLWDVKTGEFIRNLVALDSGGSGGVVWRIRANDTKLVCAVGSRNGTEETKLMVLDFDVEGACPKCS